MAGKDRAQAQHLTFLHEVGQDPASYGLFAVVRGAEARARSLPRVGKARMPSENVVDFAQQPAMGFADRTIASVVTKAGRTKVTGYWLGLTGPMGPLPTHLTEFAFYEKLYADRHPFTDWLDVLSGRMLQSFYRAWADSQPAAMADRPDEDGFAGFIAALTGAMEGARGKDAFPPRARVHYAALFAGSRSAVAIEDALSHLLGQPVRLLEFQPRWRNFEPEDRSRLGRTFATLGSDAALGDRVRSGADAIRLVIRAKSLRDYQALLPTGASFAVAAEALDAFTPGHIEWDICLELADRDAPPARLDGQTQLGWSSWCKPKRPKKEKTDGSIRADAHLRRIRRHKQGMTP